MSPLSDNDMDRLVTALGKHLPTKTEFEALRTDVQGIVRAWETATGMVTFVKWMSSIVAAVTLIWAAFTHGKAAAGQ